MLGSRSISQLKQIIDRAGKLQSMTSKARLELETSNLVLDGFVNDLINSNILSDQAKEEILAEEEPGSPKKLHREMTVHRNRSDGPGNTVKLPSKEDLADPSRPVHLGNPREFSKQTADGYKTRGTPKTLPKK